jgi:hypothetical protein
MSYGHLLRTSNSTMLSIPDNGRRLHIVDNNWSTVPTSLCGVYVYPVSELENRFHSPGLTLATGICSRCLRRLKDNSLSVLPIHT